MNLQDPPGRRELNRARTKRALEDAALRLFADHGYDETTIDEIAAAAEVSPRTFFRYFPSKEDVIGFEPEGLSFVLEGLAERPRREPPIRALREAFAGLGQAYERDRERILLRNRAIVTTPALRGRAMELERAWQDGIAQALARRSGRRRPSRPHVTAAAAAMAMLRLAVERWLAADGRPGLPHLIAAQFDVLLQTLEAEAFD